MIDASKIDTVTRHYIIAALWAECPEGTNPRATRKAEKSAREFCARFIANHAQLFEDAIACEALGYGSHPDAGSGAAAFGHDLWLTTQGHGTGFWDREELKIMRPSDKVTLGEMITKACEATRPQYAEFYRGWMYLQGAV